MQSNNLWSKIKEMTSESDLQKLLYSLRQDLKEAYKQKFEGKLKDTSVIKKLRKNIARVLLHLNKIKKQQNA